MKKILSVMAIALLAAATAFAQISTGDPTATTIKTGNRPEKGDFGLFMGMGAYINRNPLGVANPVPLPVVNFKYFMTDRMEFRAGVDIYHNSLRTRGKANSATSRYDADQKTYDARTASKTGSLNVLPGIAYHFSPKNILDVYVGAELPFGYSLWEDYQDTSGENAPEKKSTRITWTPFEIGGNLIVGLQAFIGNLPIGIGLEYCIGGKAELGNKYKIVRTEGDNKAVYYVNPKDANSRTQTDILNTALTYSSLSSSRIYLDQTFRLTVSYYFK